MSPWISVHFLQTQSDERLLAAAREGHERAFEALVHRYRRQLLRHCRRMLLPHAMADDAVQQGLLQAWLALQQGTEVRDARAWLYRVVHNAAVDALRSSGYDHEQLSDSLQGATAPHSDLERRIAVRQALAGLAALPELQRNALMRTAIEGHSHEDVAAALGLSGGSVRGLVYRARATLRASATAVTPIPVVAWLAHAGRRAVPLAERLGATGAAAGSTDAGGALLKGGVAVLTAGALVAGTAAVHPQAARRAHQPGPATAHEPGSGATAYQAARAKRDGPSVSASSAANPSSAQDRAHPSETGNAGRAGAARTSAPFNRADRSVEELRLVASVAPAHQPPRHGYPAFHGGSAAGKPQPTANAPSRGTVSETPLGSATGRGPGPSDFRGADESSAATGVPAGEGAGEPRDPSRSSDVSDGAAGSAVSRRSRPESPAAVSGNPGNAGAPSGEPQSGTPLGGEPQSGTRGSGDEGGFGGRGASGPVGYASSAPASAAEANSSPSGNAAATPQGDS